MLLRPAYKHTIFNIVALPNHNHFSLNHNNNQGRALSALLEERIRTKELRSSSEELVFAAPEHLS